MNTEDDAITQRIHKAIEVKLGFEKLGITEEICPDLLKFSKVLNEWVKSGNFQQGKIKLVEVDKKIVYQLSSIKHTVVKLVQM